MALSSSVGSGTGTDAFTTAVNATHAAISELGHDPSLVLIFASVSYDQEQVLLGVRSVAKYARIAGCSTSGEITTRGPARQASVVVMALYSDTMHFFVGAGEGVAADPREAGYAAAKSVVTTADDTLKVFILFPDVLVGNGSEILRGVQDELGQTFPIVGGASGDDFRFEQTFQYCDDKLYSGACVGVGITGECFVGIGVHHGWVPIGIPKKVTNALGAVIHEIDHKPALHLYQDYFGEDISRELAKDKLAKFAITYPLGMVTPDCDEMVIVDPLFASEDGSITCTAEIPLGADIQLMIGSSDEAIAAAKRAAEDALNALEGKIPKAIIVFSNVARSKLYGERAGEEIDAIQQVLGPTTALAGFNTYGEIAPQYVDVQGIRSYVSSFHSETATVIALSD